MDARLPSDWGYNRGRTAELAGPAPSLIIFP